MIITCEACTKRYLVDSEDIGQKGRVVRCVSCGHSWFAKGVKESVIDLFPEEEDEFSAIGAKAKKFRPSRWVFVAFFLIGLASLLIVGREHVIQIWPPSGEIYQSLGLPIEAPGTGLALERISVIPVAENNHQSLIVKGIVSNASKTVRFLPSLKVRAYGKCADLGWWDGLLSRFRGAKHSNPNLCLVMSWAHSLPETRLFPGERAMFETIPKEVNKPVTDLTVSF